VVPKEVANLLRSHPQFASVILDEAIPEAVVRLDDLRGESRNTDLLIIGHDDYGRVVISVEAKADESFGPSIERRLKAKASPRSQAERRVRRLANAIFGTDDIARIGRLRYQLVHAAAAALIVAAQHSATRSLLLIHEFYDSQTKTRSVARNAADLQAFLDALGVHSKLHPGIIVGPISVPGDAFVPVAMPLYIGKAIREESRG
jgi:hypothetical protein